MTADTPAAGSRELILSRIRAAVANAPETEIPRGYRRTRSQEGLAELLADRLDDYRATVHVVPAAQVAATVGRVLKERGVGRLVVPDGVPEEWSRAAAGEGGSQIVRDDPPLSAEELNAVDGVLTGCAVAIAETGTIVLDAGPGQGRRALTLLPDYHLCLVRIDQVAGILPEAIGRLDPARPLTWIAGPSATSDIELNRVEGVHGPRNLEVIIIDG
ncbi:hypothetical protein Misp01_59220 [Microtetraspora sp. NBRC 13810]|uniref:LutC/YkgG family protein n=1 Tax=Microtetraspora sp. NBRC 13810 TaxID=3030990 RepID=UPI0024A2AFE6|nr:LUD domain-containing protein [Microtetraspora sp. NBRC 13810]GLW10794.1 hypothetical protein Misp01_59220 [Microtetraspora sp. NBRC 13810]